MPVIRVSRQVHDRLKTYQDGLLDRMSDVIERLIDEVEGYEPEPSLGGQTVRILKEPNMRADRNRESWARIKSAVSASGSATYEELVETCANHRHPAGGRGFVEYCLDNGWLEYED